MRGRLASALAVVGATLVLPGTVAPATAATADQKCTVGTTKYVTDSAATANLEQVGFPQSWRFATGRGTVVAVIDSGVNAGNAHLDGAVAGGKSFVGGSATDDAYGHGTAVAGIIGARRIAKSVLVGAAPGATILPVRVNLTADDVKTENVAAGIRWAAEQDEVDVINVSISTGPSDPKLPALESAVKLAIKNDIVVVASAGNGPGDEPYTQVQYPAGFEGVVGVAAASVRGGVDNYSIHGDHVDVSAPGANALTTFHANGDCLVGIDHPFTSYATPYVSGLVAQLRERFPRDSAQEIVNRLTSTADRPRMTKRDDREGWGRIQPIAALTSADSSPPDVRSAAAPSSARGGIRAGAADHDPLSGPRTRLLWWALGATTLLAVAMVARPLAARRRR